MIEFILASQSPRRRELLSLCGYPFQVMVADVDETIVDIPDPAQNTIKTAQLKAEAIAAHQSETGTKRLIVLAADTIVALENQMLGKPAGPGEARHMLRLLRGMEHKVYTGMVLIEVGTREEITSVHAASVFMRPYTHKEIDRYIASGDPLDKAGAYAIQHPRFRPVDSLNGCYLGVMGLSVCQLLLLLRQFDVPLLADINALRDAHNHHPCPLLEELSAKA
jgi:MAF protein